MIQVSDNNGFAIYVASSPRCIHDESSVLRGRFSFQMILDAALASVPSREKSAWFWLIGTS
jgi:hypothetical protein